jgi:membrane-bound serine protease (ClpP class)
MTGSVPGVRVGLGFIIPAALAFAVIFLFLGRLALVAHRRPPVTGKEGLVGAQGEAANAITSGAPGYVRVRGELWRATSRTPVAPGQAVRVLDIQGLTLDVEPLMTSKQQGESS